MGINQCGFVVLLALSICVVEISSKFEFTNIICNSLDKKFSDFEYCYIKSVNRSYKYVSIKAKLFKTPITKINGVILKRFNGYNGYRPFMVNMTVDACRFLNNTKSNPIASYLYDFIRPFTNMNHNCPYDHDLLIEKLPIHFVNHQVTNVLPVPEGDYLYETNWMAYDIRRAVIKVYGTIS
ncbi:GD16676 [Drosophila simulans]|uniref:GD16676 n=1 Tax=Drosophila simulans TaxID=7240 RepID=B4R2C5_DROSI|nr:GD16676 [Drosophila simulans]